LPWILFQDGPEDQRGETLIVDFVDPVNGASNKALRLNSGTGANEWYIGAFSFDEVAARARFRVVEFSPMGRENILSLTTRSKHLAPAPAITLVDGRFKLWSYVESNREIADIGPVEPNVFHTAYLYARADGLVKLWWDGKLIFDDFAPLVNPYDGYFEWGSGSWQFDATDTIDFDWVGFGTVADLPLAVQTTPVHGAIFHDASNGFKFSVVSQAGLAPGVAASGISAMVNGVDRTAELSISGEDKNRQVSFSALVPDRIYRTVVKITDLTGTISTYPIDFDTFRSNSFTIDAEDFNFDGGQFLDQIAVGSTAASDNYLDRVGTEGTDHHELSTEAGNTPHQYRAESLVGTERNRDTVRPQYLAAQANDAQVADFNVTGVEAGEWLNYTRTFPAGNYHIYGRLANGDLENGFVASLGKVTNPTTANQTVTSLGAFKGTPGRGSQNYQFVPLTDAQSNPVSVALSGVETLRVTATEGSYSANFYLLVPVPGSLPLLRITRSNNDVVFSWEGAGLALESTDQLIGTWTAVANASSPFTTTPSGTARFFRLRR